jgi:hypothetical protein
MSEPSLSDDDSSTQSGDQTWVNWFVRIRGNEFFCEVDDEYIQDDFNLMGLSALVPYYDYALDLILDDEHPNQLLLSEEQLEMVDSSAEMLYGLIHARYIVTAKGLQAMVSRFCLLRMPLMPAPRWSRTNALRGFATCLSISYLVTPHRLLHFITKPPMMLRFTPFPPL